MCQNIRALANMSKHDFNWPENFPGGLKGLVKMALKEAQDLIADGNERDDSKSAAVEQGMLSCIRPHLNVVVNCLALCRCSRE